MDASPNNPPESELSFVGPSDTPDSKMQARLDKMKKQFPEMKAKIEVAAAQYKKIPAF